MGRSSLLPAASCGHDPATVAELLVQNGDRVKRATPLRLENTDLSRQALEATSEALRLEAERTSTAADLSELEDQESHAARVFEGDSRLLAERRHHPADLRVR